MPKNCPKVSIITVNYNQLGVTCEMLDSLREISFKDLEVIVVDNASKENPQAHLLQNYPEVMFIRSEENLGFSGGNNLGIAESSGEFLYFINNDTELIDGAIERLVALFDKVPDLGMVSPLICYHPSSHEHQVDLIQYAGTTPVNPYTARNKTIGEMELDKGQFNIAPYESPYAHGAAMMMTRTVLDKVGGMPEEFFLYYEELDWCEQIRRAGYKVYVEPQARIYHKESISVGKMSTLKTFYINRNRIFFMRRNKTKGEVFIFTLFLIFFTIPKNVLMYLLKGQFDHLKAFLKAISWNVFRKDRTENRTLLKKTAYTNVN